MHRPRSIVNLFNNILSICILLKVQLPYLRRAYGADCLEYFRAATNHDAYSSEFRNRRLQLLSASASAASDFSAIAASKAHESIPQLQQSSSAGSQSFPDQSTEFAFVAAALRGELLSLRDCDFRPLQHSRRNKRIEWSWSRQELAQWVAAEDAAHDAVFFSESAQSAAPTIAEAAASCTTGLDQPQSALLPATLAIVAVSAASASASAAATVSAVSGIAAMVRPGWFGAAMAAATAHSAAAFRFTPALLAVMEPHVQKARALRAERAAPVALQRLRAALDASPMFCALRTEAAIDYDAAAYPLGAALAAAIGLPAHVPIAELHTVSPQWANGTNLCESSPSPSVLASVAAVKQPGLPSEAAKKGKDAMMARLRDATHRATFHTLFDRFVCEVIAPALMAESVRKDCASSDCDLADGGDDGDDGSLTFYYQAFPCVRLIQPGEFSLGVHCDSAYGFSPTNLNIVVPLTAANGHSNGAAELYVESHPGAEDWHSLIERHMQGGGTCDTNGTRGRAIRFWGSQCLHWTSENTTAHTRASLDFRVIPAAAWRASHECEAVDAYAGRDGYYHCARRRRFHHGSAEAGSSATEHAVSSEFVWVRDAPMFAPDPRVGYPFIVKKIPGAD